MRKPGLRVTGLRSCVSGLENESAARVALPAPFACIGEGDADNAGAVGELLVVDLLEEGLDLLGDYDWAIRARREDTYDLVPRHFFFAERLPAFSRFF